VQCKNVFVATQIIELIFKAL